MSVDETTEEQNECLKYISDNRVAQLLDTAVEELVKAKPASVGMWLASWFAGEPGCDTLLARLAALEKEVRKLEAANSAFSGAENPETAAEPDTRNVRLVDAELADQRTWITPPAKIFQEYLDGLRLEEKSELMYKPTSENHQIDNTCSLIVVDMQNDFMPINSVTNPDGGRFAVPEGDQTAGNISHLLRTFGSAGAKVVCTRDYHPHDHCSFMNEGGSFPPHCVQGSRGSEFCKQITNTLKEMLRLSTEYPDVQIAFKGFHEDIDSFGGLEYNENFLKSQEGTNRIAQRLTCQPAWTGAFVLKSSNFESWDDSPDPNAPPDILSIIKGQTEGRLRDQIKGKRQLFVCGVALDYGVIDTVICAANDPDTTLEVIYIILDATRPAYVPGFGMFGSGFLHSQNWLLEKMSGTRVPIMFMSTKQILSHNSCMTLMRQQSLTEPVRQQGGRFPLQLGPFSLRRARAVRGGITITKNPTPQSEGEYDLTKARTLNDLTRFGVELRGSLSATSPIHLFELERKRANIPPEATDFVWAYPLNGAHHLTEDQLGVLQCLHNANFSFPVFGGFLYLKDGKVVGANALSLGEGMNFDARRQIPVELKRKLIQDGRFKQITFPALMKAGAYWFTWIKPQEIPTYDHGGFGYLMHKEPGDEGPDGDKDIWFPLHDPTLTVAR